MTGDVSDSHEYAFPCPAHLIHFFILHAFSPFSIISVSSHTAVLSRPDSGRDKIKERPPPTEEGSWFGFFFKLLLLAGVVAGGYYGYQEYLRRQRYGGGGSFTDMFSSNSHRYWLNVWSVVPRSQNFTTKEGALYYVYIFASPNLHSFPFHRAVKRLWVVTGETFSFFCYK